MTGREVNTRLYSRMKVYWYRYVASKLNGSSVRTTSLLSQILTCLLKGKNQNIANVQVTF